MKNDTAKKPLKKRDVYEVAREDFLRAVSVGQKEREQSLEDRKLYAIAGAQWSDSYGAAFKNKPKIELNKLNAAVYKVINEWRNNRITVDFIPKDGAKGDDLSDICDKLFRADGQDSDCAEAYDVAFEEMCAGGFGAFRVYCDYEDAYDDDNDKQRIRIEALPDADKTVFFDPNAKRYDKRDGNYCFVLTSYTRAAFEEEFNESPSDWGAPISDNGFDWYDGADHVYVAEYYRVEDATKTVVKFITITGDILKHDADSVTPEMLAEFEAVDTIKLSERKVKTRKVRKYILSGGGLLEDCGYIAGRYIPIIPAYGKRAYIDGVERWAGVVRYAKDPQYLYNMLVSGAADTAIRNGYRKPIMTPEQVKGYEEYWANDAVENYAYLPINPITGPDGAQIHSGPVGYTEPAQIPPAVASLIDFCGQDIKDILGHLEAGEDVDTNLSGKAIELIQTRIDQQSIIYMSNFAKSIAHAGRVWLSMAADVYVETSRKMKGVNKQGVAETIMLNNPKRMFGNDGRVIKSGDISRAFMDITADVGPTSSSKRSATVRALSSMLPMVADPADQKVISSMIMMNMEGEGISDARDYFRKQLVTMGVIQPTEEELAKAAQEQQNAPPNAQDEFLLAEARKADATAQKAQAQTIESMAKAEKAKAEAVETMASIENHQRDSVTKAVQALSKAGTTPLPNGQGV